MKDFHDEAMAYSLQNALEHGKADTSKVLPKLFQHGLKKEEIKKTIPKISEIVNCEDVEHYKNLRFPMNSFKRVHIDRNFVLIFRFDKLNRFILFYDFISENMFYFFADIIRCYNCYCSCSLNDMECFHQSFRFLFNMD